MPLFATEKKSFGFKKEVVRGTAEAAPVKFLALAADSEFKYDAAIVADGKIRGLKERFPSSPGIRSGTGTLSGIDVEASTIGDLLFGCLGSVTTTQPDIGTAPTVYQHAFNRLNGTAMPSFTFFVDRGISVKRYPLSTVKKLQFVGSADGKAMCTADMLFKTEENTGAIAPVYTTPKPLMFFQTDFKIDGVSDANVKSWTMGIDNMSEAVRTFSLSRDVKDILSKKEFIIGGGFEIYFETEAQRAKFLANTAAAISIVLTGDVLQGSQSAKLQLNVKAAKYTAFPFGNVDDLLGAVVTYEAEFDSVSQKSLEAILTNQVVSY